MVRSVSLIGQKVALRPLQIEHADALVAAATDGKLWNIGWTTIPTEKTVHAYIETALQGRAAGSVLPFVTTLLGNDEIVGSTRYWKIDPVNRKLEIGATWIAASWQRSFVNAEAKYLMLRYAFDILNCVRVQFQTDALNQRSRQAILRLGAQEEGIARNERIMPDGRKRDSVRFSIIESEWKQVRENLEARLSGKDIRPQFTVADDSTAAFKDS